jgi:adenylate cyclase
VARRRRLRSARGLLVLASALALGLTLVLLRGTGWLQPLELAAHDALVRHAAGEARNARLALVAATEEDVTRFSWPLPDGVLAQLIERLVAWDAAAIAVDIYRDRPVPPGTEALEALLHAPPRVLWVFKLRDAGNEGVAPPPLLARTPRAVLADLVPDPGEVVRRALLVATDPDSGQNHRSLGVALAEALSGQRLRAAGEDLAFGAGRIAVLDQPYGPYARIDAAGYQTLLDFRGGRDPFPRITVGQAIDGDPAAAALVRGRGVIIGSEALSVRDSFATPFSTGRGGGAPMAGAAVHAHITDQLLRLAEGRAQTLRRTAPAVEQALILGAALGGAGLTLAAPRIAWATLLILAAAGGVALATALAFAAGLLLPGAPALIALLGAAAVAAWLLHGIGLGERLRLRRAFEHYLDPRIIGAMLESESPPSFGGVQQEITAVFTDIAGFTSLSETLPPERLALLLNGYFDGICAAALVHGGLVAEFLGDGALILFGAPQPQEDHADRAVSAALEMARFAHAFAVAQRRDGVPLGETRIGVHSGSAMVGNIGTSARLKYGAVGDTMNIASRMDALGRHLGTRLCVSGDTALRCRRHRFRPLAEVMLKGRRAPMLVVLPEALPGLGPAAAQEALWDALRARDLEATRAALAALEAVAPEDPVAAFHRRRAAQGIADIRLEIDPKA